MVPSDLINVVRETRYPLDAFVFVQRGLDFTVRRAHGESEEPDLDFDPAPDPDAELDFDLDLDLDPQPPSQVPPSRHVSGAQLCEGLRDFAIQEYGLLARTVLRRWKVNSCKDFGRIVFAMVDGGLMHKTEEDSLDDFVGVFEFSSAFAEPLSISERG